LDAKKVFETGGLSYDPHIWITFLLLIHSGQHFRYTGPGSLAEAGHTTLFTSFHSASNSVLYAVGLRSRQRTVRSIASY